MNENKTIDNLMEAFTGEVQANRKYLAYAKKAEEVYAKLYKEALENLDQPEEVFYYLCPVCGNIEKLIYYL